MIGIMQKNWFRMLLRRECMKVLYGVLLTVGLCFCAAGTVGHTAAWAAAALCFFAATMVAVGQRNKR